MPAVSSANSSSSSGSCFSLTSRTVDAKTASLPARCSAWYSSGKVTLTLALVAGARADELLLEARDQPVRAELEQVAARLAALERLAVDRADEVEHHEVAVLRLALDGLERRGLLAHALELLVDLGVGRLGLAAADLEALVVAELRLRADGDLDREGERRALLGQVGQVELRVADGGDLARRCTARSYQPGSACADGLVEHRLAAELADDHLRPGPCPCGSPGCASRARAGSRRCSAPARRRRAEPRPRRGRGCRRGRWWSSSGRWPWRRDDSVARVIAPRTAREARRLARDRAARPPLRHAGRHRAAVGALGRLARARARARS